MGVAAQRRVEGARRRDRVLRGARREARRELRPILEHGVRQDHGRGVARHACQKKTDVASGGRLGRRARAARVLAEQDPAREHLGLRGERDQAPRVVRGALRLEEQAERRGRAVRVPQGEGGVDRAALGRAPPRAAGDVGPVGVGEERRPEERVVERRVEAADVAVVAADARAAEERGPGGVRGLGLGSKRVIQRRFNVSVPRARVTETTSTLRDRSER